MAGNNRARKGHKAPEINVGAEIFASLRELEELKGIPVEYMVDRLKRALVNAYRKDQEDRRDVIDDNVFVELTEQGLFMYQNKTVVEDVLDTAKEIYVDAARILEPNCQIGDNIRVPIKIGSFGRIAAQTAKQVVIQGIREVENKTNLETYSSKTQELLTGEVYRKDPTTGDMIVRIGQGSDAYDVLLRASEQIPGENYTEGQIIRVYVLEVHGTTRGTSVRVSRTHPNVVRRLFELETPEIESGDVEIRHIAREAGSRSKMAVRATKEGVDPVGACVGPRGGRVSAVVEELHGEKIDIVVWNEDPCEFVKAALSPADVIAVTLVPGQKACKVIVPDDQLSLAIGKEGQNARLAARLTGYKIDIKPASQAESVEPTPAV